jgi:hypothetical protein
MLGKSARGENIAGEETQPRLIGWFGQTTASDPDTDANAAGLEVRGLEVQPNSVFEFEQRDAEISDDLTVRDFTGGAKISIGEGCFRNFFRRIHRDGHA